MQALNNLWKRNPAHAVLLAIGLAVLLRLAVLIGGPLEIGPDEAQYWRWSRTLDFGYYSKPPLIAWVIRLSTDACGLSEFCIRLPSPLIHAATAFAVFAAFPAFDRAAPVAMELGERIGAMPAMRADRLAFWREFFASPDGLRALPCSIRCAAAARFLSKRRAWRSMRCK